MISIVANVAGSFAKVSTIPLTTAAGIGIKALKYFIDSTLLNHVTPVFGSVLYCDLWFGAEHSGIYVGDGNISNIVVDNLIMADSTVRLSTPESFTSKSKLGNKIYVSCDKNGVVGNIITGQNAHKKLNEKRFYGLVWRNCHNFSEECINTVEKPINNKASLNTSDISDYSNPLNFSFVSLKSAARKKLGATKWRLWDWDGSLENDPPAEPDWKGINAQYMRQPLNAESVAHIREELLETRAYMAEIADEPIPASIRKNLQGFAQTLETIAAKYVEVKDFLAQCPDADFSYEDLKNLDGEDFTALARALRGNAKIKELTRKMGRAYISEERKKKARVPEADRSEVHGTHRSDDLMRMLPSELLNLEDESLEYLFYARLLEKQLQTYELKGTTPIPGEMTDAQRQRTGPVVACLDTSGSMQGKPLIQAKALLLAVANLLGRERRSLHVILFGSNGETREFEMENADQIAGLLGFFRKGFGGGTDFETPLKRAFDIISKQPGYQKADVLMISDGDCQLSESFISTVQMRKQVLDCMVYSVLCNGKRVTDTFSDEVIVL